MFTILIMIGIAILVIAVLFFIIWKVRTRNFKPTSDKSVQAARINSDLEPSGFAYDLKGDYFYSLMNCWQREMGYCNAYDEGSPLFNMIMDCEPVTFSYGGKRWLIELWKGQYGITTGAEIGIYNTTREDVDEEGFKGTFYETATDAERMPLSFVLRKNGKVLMRRSDLHWWLTGFKLGEFSDPDTLTMQAKITFPDAGMCGEFVNALKLLGYTKKEFSVKKTTVSIMYGKPHSAQPLGRNVVQETAVQLTNRNNCGLYEIATGNYKDTLDKLEYLKTAMPELYEFFLHSLYARGFYEAFEWLIDLIHGLRPDPRPPKPEPPYPPCPPRPCPPKPCPPRPCPPEPCPPKPCPCPPQCPYPPESWPRPCPPDPCSPKPEPQKPCQHESCPVRPHPADPGCRQCRRCQSEACRMEYGQAYRNYESEGRRTEYEEAYREYEREE